MFVYKYQVLLIILDKLSFYFTSLSDTTQLDADSDDAITSSTTSQLDMDVNDIVAFVYPMPLPIVYSEWDIQSVVFDM